MYRIAMSANATRLGKRIAVTAMLRANAEALLDACKLEW